MTRAFRALAWLRWRIIVNTLRAKSSRDAGERWSRVLEVAVPVLIPLLMLPSAMGLGILALWGGRVLGAGAHLLPVVVFIGRLGLGAATAVVVLVPLARFRGGGGRLTRLLLLPVPRRVLHVAEMTAGIADPWLLVLVPAILLFGVGMLTAGSLLTGTAVLGAGFALLAALLALASCVSQAVQILLRDRRRAEMLILITTIVAAAVAFTPAIFFSERARPDRGPREEVAAERQAAEPLEPGAPPREADGGTTDRGRRRGEFRAPGYILVFPSELYARTVELAVGGRVRAASLPLAGLAAQAMLAFGLSATLHRRLLEQPEATSRSRRGERREVRMPRFPGLNAAASAVALAQTRTFLRTVKGKMAVYFAPILVLMVGLLLLRRFDLGDLPVGEAPLLTLMAATLCMLTVQPVLLNLFATDGAGLTLEFLVPLTDRDLVQGKLAAGALLTGLPAFLCSVVAWFVVSGPFLLSVAALLAGASAYLLFAPVAAILSAIFPRRANLNSMGKDGNPHAAAALLGTLLTATALGPPLILALFGLLVLKSHLAALVLVVGWVGVAAALGHVLAGVAAGILARRRENLGLVAQGR